MAQFDTLHYNTLVELMSGANARSIALPPPLLRCASRHHSAPCHHARRAIYKRLGHGDEMRVIVLCELEHDMRNWEKSAGLTLVATDCSGAAWRVCMDSGVKQLLLQTQCVCCIAHTPDDRLLLCDPVARVLYIEREPYSPRFM